MGEILGLGLSHYPPLCGLDRDMAGLLVATLADEGIPIEHRSQDNWPPAMAQEWGDDRGETAARRHRAELVRGFRRVRAELESFSPDLVLIVGDDQYENFREDLIPPYALLAYDDLDCRPWSEAQRSAVIGDRPNVWGEGEDFVFRVRGAPDRGRWMATHLLERGFDVAYAYRPLHHPSLSHAFINALLFLDYDRTGFDHPVLCLAVNCYGRAVVSRRGFMAPVDSEAVPDPPSPSPARMMDLGAALAQCVVDSDLRVALVASSSWSHAFLCDRTWRLRPDTPADRVLHRQMVEGDYAALRSTTVAELERAGQQEVLNWFVLFGAMDHLGRTPAWSEMVETHIFNSNKVFAAYPVG